MNEDAKAIHCAGCGAPLDVAINRAFIFCKYCGCKNVIEEEKIKANINVGGRANISANTDIESLLNTVDYLISSGKYDQAEEYLTALLLSGCDDHRAYIYAIDCLISNKKYDQAQKYLNTLLASGCEDYRAYIYQIKVALHQTAIDYVSCSNVFANKWLSIDRTIFNSLDKLKALEAAQQGREVTDAICNLMRYQGDNGLTILHKAAYYRLYDLAAYCVEHCADVNAIYTYPSGLAHVSPMGAGISPAFDLDGRPFVSSKDQIKAYKQFEKYLKAHGGVFRL